MSELAVEFMDEVPESGNPVEPSGDYACKVCGTGLTYGGRGRKPQYCDEHKRGANRGNKSSSTSSTRKSGPAVERAIDQLKALYGMAGQGAKFALSPTIGEAVYQKRDDLAESYRLLLETNARFRKLFAELEGRAAWLPIVMAHGDLIAQLMLASKIEKLTRQQPEPTVTENDWTVPGPEATVPWDDSPFADATPEPMDADV